MKQLFFSLFLLAFFACSTDGSKSEATEGSEIEATEQPKEETASDPEKQTAVLTEEDIEKFKSISSDVSDRLVEAYLQIKEALVQTNGTEAKQAAASVQEDLETEEGEAVNMIKEDIQQIASTESVEHQREHFNTLSKHMYAMVKATDGNENTLYRQFCPMAFNNTGAFWLSASEEIKNPYFGDKMLKCGKVQETIQ